MHRKLTAAVIVAAAAGATLAPGSALAAHCVSPDRTSPGFSYFGTDHVKEASHSNEGGNPGPHMGTPGASNCRDASDPSTRAPGRDR